jgi:hypothetical protein
MLPTAGFPFGTLFTDQVTLWFVLPVTVTVKN